MTGKSKPDKLSGIINKNSVFIKTIAYTAIAAGILPTGLFALQGGPNHDASNPYIFIQAGLAAILIGISILGLHKIAVNPLFMNKLLDGVIKVQLAILIVAAVWGIITHDSLAVILSIFILYLEIPLIFIATLLSILCYKQVFEFKLKWYTLSAIALNWFALIFMTLNVAD